MLKLSRLRRLCRSCPMLSVDPLAWALPVAAGCAMRVGRPDPVVRPESAAPPVSSDAELRSLLGTRAELDWYRLLALLLGAVLVLFLTAAAFAVGCLLGCYHSCCCLRSAGAWRPRDGLQSPARKADPSLLALPVASKVRR